MLPGPINCDGCFHVSQGRLEKENDLAAEITGELFLPTNQEGLSLLKNCDEVQPAYYSQFRCLADACQDTCCEGWRVGVDRETYNKYQACSDPVLQPAFRQFVSINEARTSDDQYAVLATSRGRCLFLSENLCSIHGRLGETYLGAACASFPRAVNLVNGSLEKSLELSCPEAARLVLLDPKPLQFHRRQIDSDEHRVTVASPGGPDDSGFEDEHVIQIRAFVLSLLQNRKYPISKRLVLLGHICDKLQEIAIEGKYEAAPTLLEGFSAAIEAGLFDEHLIRCTSHPPTQLSLIFELVFERVKSDFTTPRFLNLYQNEFLLGIQWAPDATLEQLGNNYAEAYSHHYLPFMTRYEHVMEHFLVNNAFRTLFPFGSESLNSAISPEARHTITVQYLLLTTYYSLAKAMLIGVAGKQGADFNLDSVVQTIQSCSKTFEHSAHYPKRILEILGSKGITNAAGMYVLTQN